jgi:hypothetical protein
VLQWYLNYKVVGVYQQLLILMECEHYFYTIEPSAFWPIAILISSLSSEHKLNYIMYTLTSSNFFFLHHPDEAVICNGFNILNAHYLF